MNLLAPNGVHHPINPVASEYLYHVIAFEIGQVSKMAQKRYVNFGFAICPVYIS